jgi:hypothetical protein
MNYKKLWKLHCSRNLQCSGHTSNTADVHTRIEVLAESCVVVGFKSEHTVQH